MNSKTAVIHTNCNNCGTLLAGKHCHECGQKAAVHRLTLHELFHEVWHVFTHTDKGILKLIKDLFTDPVSVYNGYFAGQRKRYFSPVLFFLVMAGILSFLYPYVFDYEDRITNMHNEFGRDLYHLTKYRALILLPVEAILLWLVFRTRYNLAEVAVFLLFCLGFTYTIRLIAIPLYYPLIKYKSDIDNVLAYGSYLIIWWHGSLVLARRQPAYIFALFLLVNLFMVMDTTLQFYLLFGDKMFSNELYHARNWMDVIKASYGW